MHIRALYDLKLAGANFRSHVAKCTESLDYQSCKADPCLRLKLEIIPEDGIKYYSCLLCYVDDILCIHHNADSELVLVKPMIWQSRQLPRCNIFQDHVT